MQFEIKNKSIFMQQSKTRETHRIYRSTRPLMQEKYDLYKYSKLVYVTLTEDECIQLYSEGGESNNYNGGHVGGDWLLNKLNEEFNKQTGLNLEYATSNSPMIYVHNNNYTLYTFDKGDCIVYAVKESKTRVTELSQKDKAKIKEKDTKENRMKIINAILLPSIEAIAQEYHMQVRKYREECYLGFYCNDDFKKFLAKVVNEFLAEKFKEIGIIPKFDGGRGNFDYRNPLIKLHDSILITEIPDSDS